MSEKKSNRVLFITMIIGFAILAGLIITPKLIESYREREQAVQDEKWVQDFLER